MGRQIAVENSREGGKTARINKNPYRLTAFPANQSSRYVNEIRTTEPGLSFGQASLKLEGYSAFTKCLYMDD